MSINIILEIEINFKIIKLMYKAYICVNINSI